MIAQGKSASSFVSMLLNPDGATASPKASVPPEQPDLQRERCLRREGAHSTLEALEEDIAKGIEEKVEQELHFVIDHPVFKASIILLVIVNTVTMGLEADMPELQSLWDIAENIFTFAFTAEACLKLMVLKMEYFGDRWNCLDIALVGLAVLDTWIFSNIDVGLDLQSLSVFRILRLCRLVRVFRLVKSLKSLVLVINGVINAIQSCCWVAGIVFIAIYVGAIFCVRFLGPSRMREQPDLYPGYTEVEAEIDTKEFMTEFNPFTSFGSISRAMLTLFNVAILSEWSEVVRPLMIKEPIFVVFFIFFVMLVSFAVMNVIIGMIVDNVMDSSKELQDEEKIRERDRKLHALKEIQAVVASLDTNGDGEISLHELEDIMKDKHSILRRQLAEADLQLPCGFTTEEMFCMLDHSGSHMLNHVEFVQSFYRLIDSSEFQQVCLIQSGLNQVKRLVRTEITLIRSEFEKQGRTQELVEVIAQQVAVLAARSDLCDARSVLAHAHHAGNCGETGGTSVEDVPSKDLAIWTQSLRVEAPSEAQGSTEMPCSVDVALEAVVDEFAQTFEVSFSEDTGALGLVIDWQNADAPAGTAASPAVGALRPGGAAQLAGLRVGDELVACNRVATAGKTREDILHVLRQRPLHLRLSRKASEAPHRAAVAPCGAPAQVVAASS